MIPFIGQIVMFGGNFEPRTWAFCHGQLLSISQNTALFSILGTTYGGDGRTTFGLPDLRGRLALSSGTGPGLSGKALGQKGGLETNTLIINQMPAHGHSFVVPVSDEDPLADMPNGNVLAVSEMYAGTPTNNQFYGQVGNTGNSGSGQPINNLMPYQVVNFIIALQGLFPSRN